jgi:hypothetical protein
MVNPNEAAPRRNAGLTRDKNDRPIILRIFPEKLADRAGQCRSRDYTTHVEQQHPNRNETMPNMTPIISLRITTLLQTGMTLPAAFDAVLGAGSYDKMVSDLYEELRAKSE